MLRTDLVPSRHLRNNRSRAIRRRDNPALLFLGPATPAANTSPDFNTPKRPPRIVKYIVDHICEPISPNRSTSDELSAPPQGAVKTPLSVTTLVCFVYFAREAAGALATRLSLRPLLIEARTVLANLGRLAPRECGVVSEIGATSLRGAKRR